MPTGPLIAPEDDETEAKQASIKTIELFNSAWIYLEVINLRSDNLHAASVRRLAKTQLVITKKNLFPGSPFFRARH